MKCCVFMVWKKVRLGKRVGKNGCLCLRMRPEGWTCLGGEHGTFLVMMGIIRLIGGIIRLTTGIVQRINCVILLINGIIKLIDR